MRKVTKFVALGTLFALIGCGILRVNPLDLLKKKGKGDSPLKPEESIEVTMEEETASDVLEEQYGEEEYVEESPYVGTDADVASTGAHVVSGDFDTRVRDLTNLINSVLSRPTSQDYEEDEFDVEVRLLTEDEVRTAVLIMNGYLDDTGARISGSPVEYLYSHLFDRIASAPVYNQKVNELGQGMETGLSSVPLDISLYNLVVGDRSVRASGFLKKLDSLHQRALSSTTEEESIRLAYHFFEYLALVLSGSDYEGYTMKDIQGDPVALSLISLYIQDLAPIAKQEIYCVYYKVGGVEYRMTLDEIELAFKEGGTLFEEWEDTLYTTNGMKK